MVQFDYLNIFYSEYFYKKRFKENDLNENEIIILFFQLTHLEQYTHHYLKC